MQADREPGDGVVCPKGHCTHSGRIEDLTPLGRLLGLDQRPGHQDDMRIHCPFCGDVMEPITPELVRQANAERKERGDPELAITAAILAAEDDIPY